MKKEYRIGNTFGEEAALEECAWSPNPAPAAFFSAAFDGENGLRFRLRSLAAPERTVNREPDSAVWEDSCLEFFFMPEKDDRYMNFESNPKGCLYIGLGHGRGDHVMLYKEDPEKYFDIRTFRTEEGWEVYYRIPLEFLRVFYRDVSFAGEWRANVYKCGDETRNRHYLSWNQVTSESPDFHRPQDFGCMVFEASPQD